MTSGHAELALAAVGGLLLATAILVPWLIRRARWSFAAGRQQQREAAAAERQLLEERIEARERDVRRLQTDRAALEEDRTGLAAENRHLAEQSASLSARRELLEYEIGELRSEVDRVREAFAQATLRETELRTRLQETERAMAERAADIERADARLKQEFQLLAQRIFEEQGQSFARNSRTQLDGVLTPFREQLAEFKQKVEQVYVADTRERASLLTEVKNLQRASERINLEAENLAKALKGDKKLQGNWGELVLERVLEESGLRRDHEYTLQASRRDERGEAKRPDVIIHLPDDKDVIVDSKVSLLAYERALAAADEGQRERCLRQHVADLRTQVRRLAEQDYDRLQGVRSLDFVLLFVPIESAFTLAMQHDAGLFTEAFARRIVIVSPTTLMMTLRIIHNVWRYEKQSRNAQEIANRAGALYDKLRIAMEDMVRLGAALRSAEGTYQDAMKKLATGKGNLVRQVEQLRELGAPVKRAFPREIMDSAGDEVPPGEDVGAMEADMVRIGAVPLRESAGHESADVDEAID